MGVAACELLEVELALDRTEAVMEAALRGHVEAYARAYARGDAPPGAPELLVRPSIAALGRRALAHGELARRGVHLLRLVAPILIESDDGVRAARSAPATWDAMRALADARDAAARAWFGRGGLDVVHGLAGVTAAGPAGATSTERGPSELPPMIAGWSSSDAAVELEAVWDGLVTRFLVTGRLEIVPSESARPRVFIVERGGYAIAVVPARLDTPARRFAALHELGHAVIGLSSTYAWPRVVDEAAASYVARLMELPEALPPGWFSRLGAAARARRTQIARGLDALERRLRTTDERPTERPPWALWHDPGAQAAYVQAEAIADALWRRLGPPGAPVSLAGELEPVATAIDNRVVI